MTYNDLMHKQLQYWKDKAREANARGDEMAVATIIAVHLEQLFGDNHRNAMAFYTELEQEAPGMPYGPMRND